MKKKLTVLLAIVILSMPATLAAETQGPISRWLNNVTESVSSKEQSAYQKQQAKKKKAKARQKQLERQRKQQQQQKKIEKKKSLIKELFSDD